MMVNLYSLKVFTIREYRFVIYWLMDLPVVGYYGGFTYNHPIDIYSVLMYKNPKTDKVPVHKLLF